MLVTDGNGIPLAGILSSASQSEYHLMLPTLAQIRIETRPLHVRKKVGGIIADKGYDAGWLRKAIRAKGMNVYIPKRRK